MREVSAATGGRSIGTPRRRTLKSVTNAGLGARGYVWYYNYLGSLSAGKHTIEVVVDSTNAIAEEYETDNMYTETINVVAPLFGDANADGTVNINDPTIVLSDFGRTGTTWGQGDVNADGKVDVNDLTSLLSNFGRSLSSSRGGMAAVPEPSCVVLLSADVGELLHVPLAPLAHLQPACWVGVRSGGRSVYPYAKALHGTAISPPTFWRFRLDS